MGIVCKLKMAPSLNDRILELESPWEITEVQPLLFRDEETAAKTGWALSNPTLLIVAGLRSERKSHRFPLCTTTIYVLFTSALGFEAITEYLFIYFII